jgi:hypothetical protein
VVVVLPFVELIDCLAALKVASGQDVGLLKLRQHAVNGGQAHIGFFFQQHAVHVFCRHVTLNGLSGKFPESSASAG